jgi:hypothetical protein
MRFTFAYAKIRILSAPLQRHTGVPPKSFEIGAHFALGQSPEKIANISAPIASIKSLDFLIQFP